jgi:hypothetical protein
LLPPASIARHDTPRGKPAAVIGASTDYVL